MLLNATLTLWTFGDSILDCGRYNGHGVHPAQLLVRNQDGLFPSERGLDLASKGVAAALQHRALDGTTTHGLGQQAEGLDLSGGGIALVTVGGNDLLRGAMADPSGQEVERVAARLEAFLGRLPLRPVLLGNVYDPTFGDDSLNFLPVEPEVGRRNHRRYNSLLAEMAPRYGSLVDIHAHFLAGQRSWLTGIIEPSLQGASEVRRAFLPHVLKAAGLAGAGEAEGGTSSGSGSCTIA